MKTDDHDYTTHALSSHTEFTQEKVQAHLSFFKLATLDTYFRSRYRQVSKIFEKSTPFREEIENSITRLSRVKEGNNSCDRNGDFSTTKDVSSAVNKNLQDVPSVLEATVKVMYKTRENIMAVRQCLEFFDRISDRIHELQSIKSGKSTSKTLKVIQKSHLNILEITHQEILLFYPTFKRVFNAKKVESGGCEELLLPFFKRFQELLLMLHEVWQLGLFQTAEFLEGKGSPAYPLLQSALQISADERRSPVRLEFIYDTLLELQKRSSEGFASSQKSICDALTFHSMLAGALKTFWSKNVQIGKFAMSQSDVFTQVKKASDTLLRLIEPVGKVSVGFHDFSVWMKAHWLTCLCEDLLCISNSTRAGNHEFVDCVELLSSLVSEPPHFEYPDECDIAWHSGALQDLSCNACRMLSKKDEFSPDYYLHKTLNTIKNQWVKIVGVRIVSCCESSAQTNLPGGFEYDPKGLVNTPGPVDVGDIIFQGVQQPLGVLPVAYALELLKCSTRGILSYVKTIAVEWKNHRGTHPPDVCCMCTGERNSLNEAHGMGKKVHLDDCYVLLVLAQLNDLYPLQNIAQKVEEMVIEKVNASRSLQTMEDISQHDEWIEEIERITRDTIFELRHSACDMWLSCLSSYVSNNCHTALKKSMEEPKSNYLEVSMISLLDHFFSDISGHLSVKLWGSDVLHRICHVISVSYVDCLISVYASQDEIDVGTVENIDRNARSLKNCWERVANKYYVRNTTAIQHSTDALLLVKRILGTSTTAEFESLCMTDIIPFFPDISTQLIYILLRKKPRGYPFNMNSLLPPKPSRTRLANQCLTIWKNNLEKVHSQNETEGSVEAISPPSVNLAKRTSSVLACVSVPALS